MSEILDKIKKQTIKLRYDALNKLLDQCTVEQKGKFYRIFNGTVPESKLDQAIDLCERTVKKNSEMITVRGCEHSFEEGQKFCVECGKPIWITRKNESPSHMS